MKWDANHAITHVSLKAFTCHTIWSYHWIELFNIFCHWDWVVAYKTHLWGPSFSRSPSSKREIACRGTWVHSTSEVWLLWIFTAYFEWVLWMCSECPELLWATLIMQLWFGASIVTLVLGRVKISKSWPCLGDHCCLAPSKSVPKDTASYQQVFF